jgi:hypothetical protein
VRGLWALLWRSVVLLPWGVAQFALACYAWAAFVTLPVSVVIFICNSEWWMAAACIALWIPSGLFVRWYWRWQRSDEFDHKGDI